MPARIINHTTHRILAERTVIAQTPLSRMKGLLGREALAADEALVITHCNSIHMFFMKFPLDVVFINAQGIVVGLVENIPPFALSPIFWRASSAIELPAGRISSSQTQIGHHLEI